MRLNVVLVSAGLFLPGWSCSDGGSQVPLDAAGPDGTLDIATDGTVDTAPDAMSDTTTDWTSPDAATNLAQAVVRTESGLIQGQRQDGVAVFRGIPYAAAPVGELRWRAPEPPAAWDDIRDATRYGPVCPQLPNALGEPMPGAEPSQDCPPDCEGQYCCVGSEDCLYANVWTPADSAGAALPVMVWIHGGGLNTGSGSMDIHDGSNLARTENVVIVTFNYRLGPLGFLAHPRLTQEAPYGASGNYGFLDQVRLLQWIQANIAQFGGDPKNVTVFGESAGGVSICFLLASPLARGLFHRAMDQSGPCPQRRSMLFLDTAPEVQGKTAHDQGEYVATNLGCATAQDPVACMRSLRPVDIFQGLKPSSGLFVPGVKFGGIVDGHVVEDAPLALLESGERADVPVVLGDSANEVGMWRTVSTMQALGGSGYSLQDADQTVDPAEFAKLVTFLVGQESAPLFLSLYPTPSTGSEALLAYEAFLTDGLFICPLRRAARALAAGSQDVWFYLFSRVPPGSLAEREGFGAFHASEIPYVFGNLEDGFASYQPLTPEDHELSGTMMELWSRFAATGRPAADDAPAWPAFTVPSTDYLVLDSPLHPEAGIRQAQCDAFDDILDLDVCLGGSVRPYACFW